MRLSDKICGLVNACGEIIRKEGYCQSMKFMRNNFLTVQKPNGRSDYIDLYNLRSYREKPEVRRFGDVEMLKVGRMYYSRTKNLYASKLNLSGGYIYNHKFYVAILITMLPSNAILTIRIWLVFHGDMPVSSVVIMTVTIGYADGWRTEASS